ncbi:MAG: hypothetical protein QOH35_4314 [Acidobacteriaceae bacterium]|jgi:hypothetical protein|nr:hypothetical protein [Acidobacteriaceae bacterium]
MKDSLEPEQEIVNRLVVYPLGKSAVCQKRRRFSSEDWKGGFDAGSARASKEYFGYFNYCRL